MEKEGGQKALWNMEPGRYCADIGLVKSGKGPGRRRRQGKVGEESKSARHWRRGSQSRAESQTRPPPKMPAPDAEAHSSVMALALAPVVQGT